jgi:XTP/dITP diphosphohydrolase
MGRKVPSGSKLVLASHNQGKLAELAELLRPFAVEIVSAGSLDLPEPDETASDFAGNAQIKALAAAVATGLPAFSDDSGFCAAALGGAPGVLSARWGGPDKDFAKAMALVNDRMGEAADRRAWFVAALCLAWPDGHTETFVGRVDGTMVWPPRGTHGFGYDPIFVPEGGTETFGEMDPDVKHRLSHRARAFDQVMKSCFARSRMPSGIAAGGLRDEAAR